MSQNDRLDSILKVHLKLQQSYAGTLEHPKKWDPTQINWEWAEEFGQLHPQDAAILWERLDTMCTALSQEVAELRDWTPWKHWSIKSGNKQVDTDKLGTEEHIREMRMEAIDALHFLFNIFLWLGMDAKSIHDLYMEKNAVNYDRIKSTVY
jgi:hypothetical protein